VNTNGEGRSKEQGYTMDVQWYPNDKEGDLKKQGHVVKNWKTRWFILKGNDFFYFKKKRRSKADRRNTTHWFCY